MFYKVRVFLLILLFNFFSVSVVNAGVTRDELVAAGMDESFSGFASNVSRSEGNWNSVGVTTLKSGKKIYCYGAFQFCQGTLPEYYKGTPQQFLNDKQAQVKAWNKYMRNQWELAKKNNYDKLVGTQVCITPSKCRTITESSILKACQFGCASSGKLGHYARSGNCYAKGATDGKGTSVCKYLYSGSGENVEWVTENNDSGKDGSDDEDATETAGGGGGTCFASQPVASPRIYSDYGTWNRFAGNGYHRGLDMYGTGSSRAAQYLREPILAAKNGKIQTLKSSIFLTHDDGTQTRYIHLEKYIVQTNERVNAGDKIGVMGLAGIKTKVASGSHLHFEYLIKGSMLNGGGKVFSKGEKRERDRLLTANQIKSALPNTLYYVNPEPFLKEQVPMEGAAQARTGRSTSLPNNCTVDNASLQEPKSSTETGSPFNAIQADVRGAVSKGMAMETAHFNEKSLWVDHTRTVALSPTAMQINYNNEMATALSHLILATTVKVKH